MLSRIRAGQVGDVLHVEAAHSGPTGHSLVPGNWRSTRAEAPAGGMTARGIHALDSMIQVAGLATSVYAFSDNRKLPAGVDMDDTTTVMLRFAGGATGYLSTLFTTAELYRVHVFGSKGWLELRSDTELVFRGLQGAPEKITLPAADKERAELEAFADAVTDKRAYLVPPAEAVNGIAVLEAIEPSARKGKPVRID
jgi:predicted dehydrogenase